MRAHWWLSDGQGTRRRIDQGGVLLGRAPRCDVVLSHPKASRSQALIYLDDDEPWLLVLGKGKTHHNGERVEREARLAAGDRVALPGLELEVLDAPDGPEPTDGAAWVLDRPGGGLFGVSRGPFVIGGAAGDDLQIAGWPEHAFALHPTQGRLHLSTRVTLTVDGAEIAEGELVALSTGSAIVLGGDTLRVIAGGQLGLGSTLTDDSAVASIDAEVTLQFLPRGGRLSVTTTSGRSCVYLPGQRCDLMALLLRPPDPYRRGEFLDDDLLIARVWPNQSRTRIDLNTLIYRLRRDLVRAGIDASSFIERAPGGGGTRLGLTAGAAITVE